MNTKNIDSRTWGILSVLIAGFSWGLMGIFVRALISLGFRPVDIAAMRALGAALILGSFFGLFYRDAFKLKLRDIWCMAGCGIISIIFFNICYFSAIQYTTVNIAVVLLYTSPAFVTLMSSICFKEKLTFRKMLSLTAVLAGCILVSGVFSSGGSLSPKVLLMGLGSAFFYALYTIFSRYAQIRKYSNAAITLWTFLFAGCAGSFMLDWQNAIRIAETGNWQLWTLLAGLILIVTILPYYAYTAGLKRLTPSTSAIAATIEPAVGTLVGILFFHEKMTCSAGIGMLLIIGAVLLCRE